MKCLYILTVSLAMIIGAFGRNIDLETAPTRSTINEYVAVVEAAKCKIEGQVFSNCALLPKCQLTCANTKPRPCSRICYRGCHCPSPQIIDEDKNQCVLKENCGKQQTSPVGFTLTTNRGQNDYASCAGTYLRLLDDINGARNVILLRAKPIYYSKEKNRIVFYTGRNWVITSASNYLLAVINGAKGGFYGSKAGGSPFIKFVWSPRYSVVPVFK